MDVWEWEKHDEVREEGVEQEGERDKLMSKVDASTKPIDK